MIILIKIEGRKTTVQMNGEEIEYKTAFLKKMTVNDFLLYTQHKIKQK